MSLSHTDSTNASWDNFTVLQEDFSTVSSTVVQEEFLQLFLTAVAHRIECVN